MTRARLSSQKLSKSERTRQAILSAAQRLFAQRGYQGTTVRDVASEADIDPALVIRYFGSKEQLFVRAAVIEIALPALGEVDRDAIGEQLVRIFLEVWEGPHANSGLPVLLRSAAANELSAEKMREVFATQIVPVLAQFGSSATAEQRAGLVTSQLLGLALCRYILDYPR